MPLTMQQSLFQTTLSSPRLLVRSAEYTTHRQGRRFRNTVAVLIVLALCMVSGWFVGFDLAGLWARIGGFFGYFDRLLTLEGGDRAGQRVWMDIGEWFWGFRHWLQLLADTVLMAAVGTLIGCLGGAFASFVAAENLGRSMPGRFLAKRLLEFCRTVPEIVFALIFVIAFGLGPLPGVLAIALHCFGALGKQFTEVVENIDMKPVEAVDASGGRWVNAVVIGALPQVMANFISYALLRFEINVRGAAVLGFVGAGGIGQDLIEAVRKFYYNDVAALLVMIIATVMVIDIATSQLRARLGGDVV